MTIQLANNPYNKNYDLESKADTDLSNTEPSQSFKDMSMGWGMPDYTTEVTKVPNTQYTMEYDGYIFGCLDMWNTLPVSNVVIDNILIGGGSKPAENADCTPLFCLPVAKGSKYKLNAGSMGIIKVCKLKGVGE